MTTAQLIEAIRDAIANDTALETWCQEQFGKSCTVCLGIDEYNAPTEDDYPLIAIPGVSQKRNDAERMITWEIDLGAGVLNSGVQEGGNTKTFTGFLQAEQLRELAENAVYRAKVGNERSSEGEASVESFFPLFVSYTTLTVSALKTTRKSLP